VREAIAEERVIFEHPDGKRVAGLIRVEKPYVDDDNVAHCVVIIDGLYERMPDISGPSTLHALIMAVCLGAGLLQDFLQAGGRILQPEGDGDTEGDEDFDLGQCFGPLAKLGAAPSSRRRPPTPRKTA
jgi:hypothetical protein